MAGYLEITPALSLPLDELDYRASRSGGPGGQHVNTSSTRVEVSWDVAGFALAHRRAADSTAHSTGFAARLRWAAQVGVGVVPAVSCATGRE